MAKITTRQRPGSAFMPMHWSGAYAPSGRSNPLVAPRVDPRSGQPEFKHTPARVRPYRETWRGFFLARDARKAPDNPNLVWRRVPQAGCQLHEFAGRGEARERADIRRHLSRLAGEDVIRFEDEATGAVREAHFEGGRLASVLFMTGAGSLPPREWLVELFARDELGRTERTALLLGRPLDGMVDSTPIVCACRGVRASKIDAAVAAGCGSVEAVGEATGAGTSCGSCKPEIARRMREAAPDIAPGVISDAA